MSQPEYEHHTYIAWQMPEKQAEHLTLDFLLKQGAPTKHLDTFHYRHSTIQVIKHLQQGTYTVELDMIALVGRVTDDIHKLRQYFPEFHHIPYVHPEAPEPIDYDSKKAYDDALATWEEPSTQPL